ncbi:DNA/RNA non-specific endonuclease [Sphingomonas sp. DT-204]|uniref:DNA/RNA non-specific endonuclease n=1 Tax=Sphingomonas sp. DT-204 TaxID=3396166 RepID=UPI003F1C0AAE
MAFDDPIAAVPAAPIATDDPSLSVCIAEAVANRKAMVPPAARQERAERARADTAFPLRVGLIESPRSDPNGFERLIGESDLLSINFLDRGRRAADAVCRVKLPMEGGHAYGTGFLVGPRLLLTNNHVLASAAEAAQAEAELGYDHDLDGVVRDPVQFNLDPRQLFFTSSELDITLVAVVPIAQNGVPLDRYGWLPLLPLSGKGIDGEWVTIIQHPNGQPKQIAIHASQIIKVDPAAVDVDVTRFIHYSTDTEPGSSGAPVFNDQWQVVAIHHKAVPAPDSPPDDPHWLANEGVRISAIFNLLERNRFEDDDARRALDRLGRAMGFPPIAQPAATAAEPSEKQFAPFKDSRWQAAGLGYDPDFLSEPIPLDPIYAALAARGEVAPLLDGSGHELRYFHFSSVMSAERRFPILTAVNIDGLKLVRIERKDSWRPDGRIDARYQSDDEFYVKSRADENVYFSRGHMVRLLDPCWSDATDPAKREADARRGMEDTFHFTNAAPQVQTYNDQDWGNLEDYVLDKAQTSERRLSVFTGPIYRDNDPVYGRERKGGPWRIPLSFWKIAVLQKSSGTIAAAAFIIGQTEYVRALYEAKVFSGLRPYTIDEMRSRKIQTTIAAVEEVTGLDFGDLKTFDAHGSLESTRRTRWFDRLDDIVI